MLCARTPLARVRELLEVIGNDCRSGRAFFYRSLDFIIMSDVKQPFYKSKAFWTLVSSIIAALAAFFLASCSAQARMQRSGVHIDTVRVDYIIRSNNLTHM
nr:MAG TPA: lipoprotein [Microviridae sp.]